MRYPKFISFVLAAILTAACAPKLVPPGWELLGRRQVNVTVDHDTVPIPPGKRTHSRLLVIVRVNDLELYDIRITFENGESFAAGFRGKFLASRDRRFIDLPGRARRVVRVDFRYRSLNPIARRAEVELWGN